MYKVLRIICCVICAVLVAACIPVFALFDWYWGIITLVSAAIFFLLMLMFKGLQGDYERAHPTPKENPPTEDKDE